MSCLDGNKDRSACSSGWLFSIMNATSGGSRLQGPKGLAESAFVSPFVG